MDQRDIKQAENKIQSDTEKETNRFYEARRAEIANHSRKAKAQVEGGRSRSTQKEMRIGQSLYLKTEHQKTDDGILTLFGLGLTLALVNDFSDLVTWQALPLMSQALDLVALLLILFVLVFSSRTSFIAVFVMISAFVLEILPVSGVVPWWTVGIALWYLASRNKE